MSLCIYITSKLTRNVPEKNYKSKLLSLQANKLLRIVFILKQFILHNFFQFIKNLLLKDQQPSRLIKIYCLLIYSPHLRTPGLKCLKNNNLKKKINVFDFK